MINLVIHGCKQLRYVTLLCLFLLSAMLKGQEQAIKFSNLLPENGLSHSFVTSIIQDHKGYMWFGTKDGLNKYDGYTITVYKNDPDNKQSLSHNFIQDLTFDKEGNLWIASWGGLTKYDIHKEVFTQYKQDKNNPNSIPNDLISSVLEDDFGNLWIGSAGGLILFDRKNNKFITYKHDKDDRESLGDDYVRDIHMDRQKRLWVGTFNGGLNLFNFKTGKFKRYQHDDKDPFSIGDNSAYTIFEDSHDRLWIGTHLNGFDLLDKNTGRFTHFRHDPKNSNSVVHNVVSCFSEDASGNIWVGTENGGLSIFNPTSGKFQNYIHDDIDDNSLENNSLYAIYRDVSGNMWIGTFAGGVNFYSIQGSKFQHFRHNSSPFSLSNNNILCIFEDSHNNLWIGTDGGGANFYDRSANKMIHFRHDPMNNNSIAGDYILSIAEDGDHRIWFGTWGAGISVYDPAKKTFKHYKHNPSDPNSLNSDNAWIIYKCSQNNMWVGTYRGSGLNLFDKNTDKFTSYSHKPNDAYSLSSNYVNYMYEDSKGNFWISTAGGGINLFDKKNKNFTSIQRDNKKNSLSSNNVDCIFEDSRKNLWLATDLGLNLMDPVKKEFTTFTTKDGLPSNLICGIQEDKNGYLWISTINGVSKFNYTDKSFTNYTVADGLQSHEFKPHAFCKSVSGAMYFGGINGFNEFFPDSLSNDELDFPLLVTDFSINNKSVSVGESLNGRVVLEQALPETKNIVLSYQQAFFSFEFATLNYTVPEKNNYAYMLEGFDKDWNYIGNRRLATYTDVPPGKYTFRVKTSHDGGGWEEKQIAINISITPPFWDTWWFKVICLLTVIGAAVSFFTIRIKNIRRQKEALERQVQERTYDLQVAAKEIKTQRDSLKSANEYVMSSINYAKTIQKSILSPTEKIEETASEYFIIYRPKDVVSGDFYWFSHLNREELNPMLREDRHVGSDIDFVAAVDCTGHGVSGAFMSIIGNTLFNEIVNQKHILEPSLILESLHEGLDKAVNTSDGVSVIGMDVCLCRLEEESANTVKVTYAGAKRPLFFVRKGSCEVGKINGDIISIGSDLKQGNSYSSKTFLLEKGSMLYLTTDGYIDQNNASNEKIGTLRLRKLIEECCHLPVSEQKELFEKELLQHQGEMEQRDDITIIGIRV